MDKKREPAKGFLSLRGQRQLAQRRLLFEGGLASGGRGASIEGRVSGFPQVFFEALDPLLDDRQVESINSSSTDSIAARTLPGRLAARRYRCRTPRAT